MCALVLRPSSTNMDTARLTCLKNVSQNNLGMTMLANLTFMNREESIPLKKRLPNTTASLLYNGQECQSVIERLSCIIFIVTLLFRSSRKCGATQASNISATEGKSIFQGNRTVWDNNIMLTAMQIFHLDINKMNLKKLKIITLGCRRPSRRMLLVWGGIKEMCKATISGRSTWCMLGPSKSSMEAGMTRKG